MSRKEGGTLVTLEGIDGSGKTSVSKYIDEEINDSIVTSEPTDFWTGDVVRDELKSDTPSIQTFFAFMMDRIAHIEEVISPFLSEGELIISDRFSDSSRAYQSAALEDYFGAGQMEARTYINSLMAPWNLEPDLTIYIDISVDTAMERCDKADKYENRENLRDVKENYDLINDLYEHRVEVVDGSLPLETVRSRCKAKVLQEVGE